MTPDDDQTDAPPGRRCRNRQSEWTAVFAITVLGLFIVAWPTTLERSHFVPITDKFGPFTIAAACLMVGIPRALALWNNGHWGAYGALIRCIGAIAGMAIIVSIDVALIRQSFEAGRPPSPGIPFYTALALAEFFSAGRAAGDVRHQHRI